MTRTEAEDYVSELQGHLNVLDQFYDLVSARADVQQVAS